MEGIIIINKPKGVTSHDVVNMIRRRFKMRRVGHAGTLDPLATGVLVLLLGRSTKLFDKFSAFDKSYKATLTLGLKTTTADINGKVIQESDYSQITREQIEKMIKGFIGEIKQVPPMVSALKVNGQRLYQLARKGIEVKRVARDIRIDSLQLDNFAPPLVDFSLDCSKGTYVRKLGEDIGDLLGCGGCISKIERTKVGPFDISESVTIEDVNEGHIRNWQG